MFSLGLIALRLLGSLTGAVGLRGVAAVTESKVGELHVARGDFNAGAAAFGRARALDTEPAMQALDLGNLGFCLFRLGRLAESARAYQDALVIRYRVKFHDSMTTDLHRYYHVCHYLGERQAALDAYAMYRTPAGMPVLAQLPDYPIELDATGHALQGT